jgi:hypothetical protein
MAAVFASQEATPRNITPILGNPVALLASRLSKLPLEDIARALGKDDTAACKIRSGERACTVGELAKLIPLCGLKLVDRDKVCVDRQAYESMTYIATKAMSNQSMAQQLVWDESPE